jgi:hypothetical protein
MATTIDEVVYLVRQALKYLQEGWISVVPARQEEKTRAEGELDEIMAKLQQYCAMPDVPILSAVLDRILVFDATFINKKWRPRRGSYNCTLKWVVYWDLQAAGEKLRKYRDTLPADDDKEDDDNEDPTLAAVFANTRVDILVKEFEELLLKHIKKP